MDERFLVLCSSWVIHVYWFLAMTSFLFICCFFYFSMKLLWIFWLNWPKKWLHIENYLCKLNFKVFLSRKLVFLLKCLQWSFPNILEKCFSEIQISNVVQMFQKCLTFLIYLHIFASVCLKRTEQIFNKKCFHVCPLARHSIPWGSIFPNKKWGHFTCCRLDEL